MNKLFISLISLFALSLAVPGSVSAATYYVSTIGNDANAGTQTQPWKTYQKAVQTVPLDSLVYIRGGIYTGTGADFKNSNVTIRNYPDEQVVIQMSSGNIFYCWTTAGNGAKTDIRVIGSDVTPRTLSNGVVSKKGIVIIDEVGSQRWPFRPNGGCDRWEVAGIDFIDVAAGVFTLKQSYGKNGNLSADNWYVHDNRVYRFYRETGMQFNGNDNIIENNEIVKGTTRIDSPYGCYLLNLLGHGNIVRSNIFNNVGGPSSCSGSLFEWSQSDNNLIENNTFTGVKNGVESQGGDNNVIKNNFFTQTVNKYSFQNYPSTRTSWPCDDRPGGSGDVLVPPNDPNHVDYPYYYPYGECESRGNQIIEGTPGPSTTAAPTTTPTPTLNIADLDQDGDVDGNDFNTLVSNFNISGALGWIRSDILQNGKVDIFDFNKLITNFGL